MWFMTRLDCPLCQLVIPFVCDLGQLMSCIVVVVTRYITTLSPRQAHPCPADIIDIAIILFTRFQLFVAVCITLHYLHHIALLLHVYIDDIIILESRYVFFFCLFFQLFSMFNTIFSFSFTLFHVTPELSVVATKNIDNYLPQSNRLTIITCELNDAILNNVQFLLRFLTMVSPVLCRHVLNQ